MITVNYIRPFCALAVAALLVPFYAEHAQANQNKCPKNPTSVNQLKQCPRADQWRVNYDALEKLRAAGHSIPLEWRDNKGKSVNTGGVGSVAVTARQKPTTIPTSSGGGGGFPGLGSLLGGGFPSGGGGGDGGDDGEACEGTYPPPLDVCHMEGAKLPLTGGSTTPKCGASVQLTSQWLTLVKDANAAAFAEKDNYSLKTYTRSRNDYRYSGKSSIPEFYCQLKEIPDASKPTGIKIIAEKIAITPLNQYNELSNAVKTISIAVSHTDGTTILPQADDNFIPMKRTGRSTFRAPTPNPSWFSSRGAEDVDAKCYTPEQLLAPIERNFGDIRFRNLEQGSCSVEHLFPLQCPGYTHYVDLEHMQMMFSEGQRMTLGKITGSSTFATNTIASTEGNFATDPNTGVTSYNGSSVFTRGGHGLYLGSGLTQKNEQAFLGGARLFLYNGSTVRINTPGRIILESNGRMQLIDGGVIESVDGVTLRTIAPMAYVNFKEPGKPMQLIKGSLGSEVKVSGNSLIPAAKDGFIRLPFNTAKSVACHTGKQ